MAVAAVVLLVISLPSFSRGVFSIGVGANISYSAEGIVPVGSNESGEGALSNQKPKFSFDNVAIGLETRVNLSYLQLTAVGELSSVDSNTILASGILAGGLSFDLFSLFRIGVSAGPKISYAYTAAGANVSNAYYSSSRTGSSQTGSNDGETSGIDLEKTSNGKAFWDAVRDGNFNLRFTLDIIAGPVLTIGAAYVVPTDFSMSKENFEALIPDDSAWGKGQVSLCVQMSLF